MKELRRQLDEAGFHGTQIVVADDWAGLRAVERPEDACGVLLAVPPLRRFCRFVFPDLEVADLVTNQTWSKTSIFQTI